MKDDFYAILYFSTVVSVIYTLNLSLYMNTWGLMEIFANFATLLVLNIILWTGLVILGNIMGD